MSQKIKTHKNLFDQRISNKEAVLLREGHLPDSYIANFPKIGEFLIFDDEFDEINQD